MMTEELYDLLTTAHFSLLKAYDAVPRWLGDESDGCGLVTADELQSLRTITTENALLANDLAGDIDALLDDVPGDRTEVALVMVRDALEMLQAGFVESSKAAPSPIASNSFCDMSRALDASLDIVDGIIAHHGFVVPSRVSQVQADLRSAFGSGTRSLTTAQEPGQGMGNLREDRRRQAAQSAPVVSREAHRTSAYATQRETPGTWDEQASRGEQALETPMIERCLVCDTALDLNERSAKTTVGRTSWTCNRCFMMGL